MPSIYSVRDFSLGLPDVVVACWGRLDVVNNCFGLTIPIEHAFSVYLGASACTLMVFVCLLLIELAVFNVRGHVYHIREHFLGTVCDQSFF